ncbi:MAG: LuxR C-terminal-related transcriptional regulator, partial [Panacagrimonas sp.]
FERRSMFLIALDDRREWYRLHALFRGFLRARAAAEDAERARRDTESAVRWCVEHGLREEAIDYALQAGLLEDAASLIAEHAEQLVRFQGEHERLVEWIRRLPPELLARHPTIQLDHAWALTFQNRFVEAEAALEVVSRSLEGADPPSLESLREVQRARELNACLTAALTDHAAPAIVLSRKWLASWPDASDRERGPVFVTLAYGYKCTADFSAVASAVEEARRCLERVGTPFGLAWIEYFNVLALMRQGRYSAARTACTAAMSTADERLGRNALLFCMQSALMAAIELEFNNLAAAREALAHGLKFLEPHGHVDSILVAYVTLARLMAAEGRFVDACDLLQEGEATGRRRDTPRLTISLAAERALLLLRNGQLETVAELLRTELRSPREDEEFAGLLRDKRVRIEARLALARGAAAEALETVAGLLHHVRQTQQLRKHVELLLIRAMAQQAMGRSNDALRTLTEALRLAAPERLMRVFLDEGERLHPLIGALKAADKNANAGADDESLQKLLEQLASTIRSGGVPHAVATQSESGVLDPLTPRELQILRMMESGMSAKQLARALFVSEGTVKWHLYNMYGKLDVRNRSAAIAKARRTGLM